MVERPIFAETGVVMHVLQDMHQVIVGAVNEFGLNLNAINQIIRPCEAADSLKRGAKSGSIL